MAKLSRRELLAAGAALSLTPRLRAAARPRALGFSLYGMKDWRLGDAMEVCGRLGYEAIELCLLPGFPTDPERFAGPDRQQLRFQLTDLDLGLAGLMENLRLTVDDAQHAANLERLRRAAELAHELVPAAPPPIETVMGGKPEQWDALRESMAERLNDWAKLARQLDVTIAIKPHVGSAAHRPEHALWLMDQVGSSHIRAAYDFSHYRLQGLDMAATLDALLPKTVFVHVKDAAGQPGQVEFLLPGQGDIDYVQLFQLLAKGGYEGPVVVEGRSSIAARTMLRTTRPSKAWRRCWKLGRKPRNRRSARPYCGGGGGGGAAASSSPGIGRGVGPGPAPGPPPVRLPTLCQIDAAIRATSSATFAAFNPSMPARANGSPASTVSVCPAVTGVSRLLGRRRWRTPTRPSLTETTVVSYSLTSTSNVVPRTEITAVGVKMRCGFGCPPSRSM